MRATSWSRNGMGINDRGQPRAPLVRVDMGGSPCSLWRGLQMRTRLTAGPGLGVRHETGSTQLRPPAARQAWVFHLSDLGIPQRSWRRGAFLARRPALAIYHRPRTWPERALSPLGQRHNPHGTLRGWPG